MHCFKQFVTLFLLFRSMNYVHHYLPLIQPVILLSSLFTLCPALRDQQWLTSPNRSTSHLLKIISDTFNEHNSIRCLSIKRVILHEYIRLCCAQLIHEIPLQADLLLRYLMQDPRKVVKNHALADLKMLAKGTPHMWRLQHIEVLMFDWYLNHCFF